jgi:RimJ/RimL family protein N-acetyltransferase
MTGGEWREYDAPWELVGESPPEAAVRAGFQRQFMRAREQPRHRLIIASVNGQPLGWVNRYSDARFTDCWYLGICIGEDDFLGRGLGTEAFWLWIDYLFAGSEIHRLGFMTYSFNVRMIRVAEKLGISNEGSDREIINWHGRWIDRVRFGILRREWEELRSTRRDGP